MKTYTCVARDINSWSIVDGPNGPGKEYAVTWDCGHQHRSQEAAEQCLRKMGDAACAYNARIECN